MNRGVKAIATGVVAAMLAACGGTSGGGSQSQDQQTVLTGRQACVSTEHWGGTEVGTTPDSDAGDPADIICQTKDRELVILDGEDGELESDSNRYAYYEESDTEAGVFFLAVYAAGKVIKFAATILKPPAGYKKPVSGQYTPPTRPRNPGTVTGGSEQKASSSPSPTCAKRVNGRCK